MPTAEGRLSLTQKIIDNGLNVREAENLARLMSGKKDGSASTPREPMPGGLQVCGEDLTRDTED